MTKVLVTGGTGFIGANLVAGLNDRGLEVIVLRRASSSLEALDGLAYQTAIGDVLDAPEELAVSMEGCSWVFHTAAVSDYWRHNKDWLYRVNVDGTRNVLRAAILSGVKRFVFTSSVLAMGVPMDGQLIDETDRFNLNPKRFPYAHSKHLAEVEVGRAVEEGLRAIIVNPTYVLGPRDVNQVSGSLITEAAKGWLRFNLPGGVNFVAVEDVVLGHMEAAIRGRVGDRYILAGSNIPYEVAAHVVCQVVGQPTPSITVPSRILPVASLAVSCARLIFGNRIPLDANQVWLSGISYFANGQKAVDELGMPKTPFETIVQRTYDWYCEHGYL